MQCPSGTFFVLEQTWDIKPPCKGMMTALFHPESSKIRQKEAEDCGGFGRVWFKVRTAGVSGLITGLTILDEGKYEPSYPLF